MKAFLDLETGGFSVTKNGVCEIAAVATNSNLEEVDFFHCLIKPYMRDDFDELVSYKDDAMAVNGLTVEELIEKGLDVGDAMIGLHEFLDRNGIQTIVAHCGRQFDAPRVQYLSNRFIGKSISHLEILDTIDLAKEKLQLPSYSLPSLCAHFGVINEKEHSAHGDSVALLEVYRRLITL